MNRELSPSLVAYLGAQRDLRFRQTVDAKRCTTFCIGGNFAWLAEPDTRDALVSLVKRLAEEEVPWRILGAGSNLLVQDAGVSGVTIRLGRGFREYTISPDGTVKAGGAAALMTLSRDASERGLSGLEFAGGIPASIGGAVRMNAGAHGGDMAGVLASVDYVDVGGELRTAKASEIAFSYRHTSIPSDAIICGAHFALVTEDPEQVSARRAEFLAERKRRQPLAMPSAGSVFRNPSPTQPAGKLIEEAGLKGLRHGGAMISTQHGNWIVNPERTATFEDVTALIATCQKGVMAHSAISLETEVVRWQE